MIWLWSLPLPACSFLETISSWNIELIRVPGKALTDPGVGKFKCSVFGSGWVPLQPSPRDGVVSQAVIGLLGGEKVRFERVSRINTMMLVQLQNVSRASRPYTFFPGAFSYFSFYTPGASSPASSLLSLYWLSRRPPSQVVSSVLVLNLGTLLFVAKAASFC